MAKNANILSIPKINFNKTRSKGPMEKPGLF
jgi:hypothetical protein